MFSFKHLLLSILICGYLSPILAQNWEPVQDSRARSPQSEWGFWKAYPELEGHQVELRKGVEGEEVGVSAEFPQERLGKWASLSAPLSTPLWIWGAGSQAWTQKEVDTLRLQEPWLLAQYQKMPFDGIFFRADFRRPLPGPWSLGLSLETDRTEITGDWDYQNQTHQPYLGAGRDSNSIPFAGRGLGHRHFRWSPWLGFEDALGGGKLQVQLRYSATESSMGLPSAEEPTILSTDPLNRRNFDLEPWDAQEDLSRWSLKSIWQDSSQKSLSLLVLQEKQNRQLENLPLTERRIGDQDTLRWASSTSWNAQRWFQSLESQWPLWNPIYGFGTLRFQNNWKNMRDTSVGSPLAGQPWSEDHQILQFGWNGTQAYGMTLWAGAERYSDATTRISYAPLASWTWQSLKDSNPWYPIWTTRALVDQKWPTTYQLLQTQLWEPHFANPWLKSSQRMAGELKADWQLKTWGLWTEHRFHAYQNPILPNYSSALASLPHGATPAYDAVFQSVNGDQAYLGTYALGLWTQLGNWRFALGREGAWLRQVEEGNLTYDHPEWAASLWQGSVVWRRKLLQHEQLDLEIRWDGTRIGSRRAWSWNPDAQTASVLVLDPTWTVDFETRARIQSFVLYAQIRNLAHQSPRIAPGYAAPGAQFLWGITWTFLS
jgi:hypothetical protein